jgi:hypothetical protein
MAIPMEKVAPSVASLEQAMVTPAAGLALRRVRRQQAADLAELV